MSMQLVRLESALKYHICLLQNHVLKHYVTNIFTILNQLLLIILKNSPNITKEF